MSDNSRRMYLFPQRYDDLCSGLMLQMMSENHRCWLGGDKFEVQWSETAGDFFIRVTDRPFYLQSWVDECGFLIDMQRVEWHERIAPESAPESKLQMPHPGEWVWLYKESLVQQSDPLKTIAVVIEARPEMEMVRCLALTTSGIEDWWCVSSRRVAIQRGEIGNGHASWWESLEDSTPT